MTARLQTLPQIVQPLLSSCNSVEDPRQNVRDREPCVALSRLQQTIATGAKHGPFQRLHALRYAMLRGGDDLRRRGRCGRAQIGRKIGNGEVRLMPDRGDDGQLGRNDRARDGFFIEAGEIFE